MKTGLLFLLLSGPEFDALLDRLAEGWNRGDARKAAEGFTDDAVYVEPPDRQRVRGRDALREFFAETARIAP